MKPTSLALLFAALLLASCTKVEVSHADEPGSVHAAEPAEDVPSTEAEIAETIMAVETDEAASSFADPTNDAERILVRFGEGMQEVVELVKGVDDEAGAEAAAEKIRAIAERLEQDQPGYQQLSATAREAAEARYQEPFSKVMSQLMVAFMNLGSKPELMKPLQDAIEKLPNFEE